MHRTALLQNVIDRLHASTYVEIGFFEGDNFFAIRAPRKFAVDPCFHIWRKAQLRHLLLDWRRVRDRYYEMTSDDFFARFPPHLRRHGLDVVLIDGLHTYAQSLRDTTHSLEHLNPRGVILLHDCSPLSETAALPATSPAEAAQQAPPGWDGMWNGDVWKTVAWLRAQRNDLRVFTLDSDFGICVVTRGTPESRLSLTPDEIDAMTYRDLEARREELLNLKPARYAAEFLSQIG